MHHKKRREEWRKTGWIISVLIIVILGILIYKKPSITGKVITTEPTVFNENLNIQKNESGAYKWVLKNPGNLKSLKATGSVSSNGTARVYIEKNGTRYLLFDSTKQLLDVNINVLPEYKRIFQGEEILIQNVLFNLRGFGAGNVNVKYSIKDSKGNLIASEEETVFIETQAKFIRKLLIPSDIKTGTYLAYVEVSTNETIVGSGSDTFEIKSKFKEAPTQQLRYYIIGLAVVVAVGIVFILGVYGLRLLRKKEKIAKLKERMAVEKIQRLENELKSLEEAYSSGFISEKSYRKDKERVEQELMKLRK